VGIVVCLVAITLYPLFGVYRGDNFWIPAVAVLYAFVFATMLLANVLKQRKLFQAFLVVQVRASAFHHL
jgi:FtsH-binding integral membrane protein